MSASAEMSIKPPVLFEFLPTQVQILQDNVTAVQMKERKKDKQKLIKKIRKDILELPESKNLPLEKREDLKIAIDSWFARRTSGGGQKIRFGKRWNGRMVLYDEQKDEINRLKEKLYQKAKSKGKKPKKAFHYFQIAVSEVWKKLEEKEQDRYEMMAEKWNSEGVSREKKRETASKLAVHYIKRFANDMFKSMGVRFLFMIAMESTEGSVETGVLDFNDSIDGGTSYLSANHNWSQEGIDADSWNDHWKDYYSPEEGVKIQRKLPRKLLKFEENDYGEPILPNPIEVPKRQNARTWRQAVVRGFLTRHYELASGRSKAIPWTRFLKQARECIDEEYLPEEKFEHLGEPSTMRDGHCHDLLQFWYERQEAGDCPVFRFSKYLGTKELFPAKPRTLQEKVTPQSPGGVDNSAVDGPLQSKSDGEGEVGKITELGKKAVKGKDKERRKAKRKGKGKQKQVEEDSAEVSSSTESSSSEPSSLDDSDDSDELDEEELDWMFLDDERGIENVADGSGTRGKAVAQKPSRSSKRVQKNKVKESSAEGWSNEYGGIKAMLSGPDKMESGEGSGQIAEDMNEASGQTAEDMNRSSATPGQPMNLEQTLIDLLACQSPLNLQNILIKSLGALHVQSQPASPQKEPTVEPPQAKDKKRARSSSPEHMVESPIKKTRELDPEESTSCSSILDLTVPLDEPKSTKTGRVKSSGSATKIDRGGKSSSSAAKTDRGTKTDNSRVTTRAQIKSTQRSTRSKV